MARHSRGPGLPQCETERIYKYNGTYYSFQAFTNGHFLVALKLKCFRFLEGSMDKIEKHEYT